MHAFTIARASPRKSCNILPYYLITTRQLKQKYAFRNRGNCYESDSGDKSERINIHIYKSISYKYAGKHIPTLS